MTTTTLNREEVRNLSIGIANAMTSDSAIVRCDIGHGDARLVWLRVDGCDVIATNADPVWEDSDPEGFEQLAALF